MGLRDDEGDSCFRCLSSFACIALSSFETARKSLLDSAVDVLSVLMRARPAPMRGLTSICESLAECAGISAFARSTFANFAYDEFMSMSNSLASLTHS